MQLFHSLLAPERSFALPSLRATTTATWNEFYVCFVFLSLRGETVKPRSHSNDRKTLHIKDSSEERYRRNQKLVFFLFLPRETRRELKKCAHRGYCTAVTSWNLISNDESFNCILKVFTTLEHSLEMIQSCFRSSKITNLMIVAERCPSMQQSFNSPPQLISTIA